MSFKIGALKICKIQTETCFFYFIPACSTTATVSVMGKDLILNLDPLDIDALSVGFSRAGIPKGDLLVREGFIEGN